MAAMLAPGALCARSQTAVGPDPVSDGVAPPLRTDTLHITPAMIDSIRNTPVVEDFDQQFKSTVFVPKGQWIAGVSLSYTQSTQNNYQFFIVEGISGDTYSLKVSPMLMYAFRNDMAAGAKFSYTRALTKLERADFVLDSETSESIEALYSLSHNYYGTALYRNYFSLGNSRRFGFFNEVQLQLGGGQSKVTTGRGEDITGTYERNFSLDVGIVPGLIVFLSNYSAIEVNVGVLGFSYTATKAVSDQIYVSRRHTQSANFRINLFSITFGATFYI